jgi:integrase
MAHVRATAEHLSPVLKAMVMIQAATGMRPSELFNMRPCNVDRSGDVWIYRPPVHKTSSKGKKRAIPIVGAARATLVPFLLRPADQCCFSPAESYKWYQNQRSANRKTRKGQGNEVGTCCKTNPRWKPGSKFRRDSYRNAILRAAKKAKVPHWYPYQLRHTAATRLREALGIEAAQALLGHSTVNMTERYAKQSEARAIEAAKALA